MYILRVGQSIWWEGEGGECVLLLLLLLLCCQLPAGIVHRLVGVEPGLVIGLEAADTRFDDGAVGDFGQRRVVWVVRVLVGLRAAL